MEIEDLRYQWTTVIPKNEYIIPFKDLFYVKVEV